MLNTFFYFYLLNKKIPINIQSLLAILKEHRLRLYEIIGYSIANYLEQHIFTELQKVVIDERIKN